MSYYQGKGQSQGVNEGNGNWKYQYERERERVQQLERDNEDLSRAIQDLNDCYQQKIRIMEESIAGHHSRCEELLEWKKEYIGRSLFQVEKYEGEIKKMIEIMENLHHNFQKEKQGLEGIIQSQKEEITSLRQSNEQLQSERDLQQSKIEELAQTYIDQIQRLNSELRDLKEQCHMSEDSSNVSALKDISNSKSIMLPLSEKSSKFTAFQGNENVLQESINA